MLRSLFASRATIGDPSMQLEHTVSSDKFSSDKSADNSNPKQEVVTPEVKKITVGTADEGKDFYKITWGDGRPDQVIQVMPEEMFDIAS